MTLGHLDGCLTPGVLRALDPSGPSVERPSGLQRLRTLWRLFRNEREEPAPFYRLLAAELVDALERRHGSLAGARILDLGCGPGWYAEALRNTGASVVALDGAMAELAGPVGAPPCALIGDGGRLPFPDASLDGIVCSNMLEHARDTRAVFEELRRVLRPGGWAYMSWTNWYSPHGGHDMTPWHLLGPSRGPAAYERRHGPPRKNRYGEGLFAVHIGPTLQLVDELDGIELEQAEPRYWPWARFIVRIPGLREVATWNCVLHLRRSDADADAALDKVMAGLDSVAGWMSDGQARILWDRARTLRPGATVVEIGSYQGRSTTVLATAVPPGTVVVAIDPHAGNDRGPQQWEGSPDEGEADHQAFKSNLAAAGIADRVRHVRRFSHDALGEVEGGIDLLYVDGAHGYGPARDDLRTWGDRVALDGTLLVHDAYSSVGVTLALIRTMFFGRHFHYRGRSRSMVEYRRQRVAGGARFANALRQAAELPWFARNLVIKALLVAHLRPLTRLLGHRDGSWPY